MNSKEFLDIINPPFTEKAKRRQQKRRKREETRSIVLHYQLPLPSNYPTYKNPPSLPQAPCMNCGLYDKDTDESIATEDESLVEEFERRLVKSLAEEDSTLAAMADPAMSLVMRDLFKWW